MPPAQAALPSRRLLPGGQCACGSWGPVRRKNCGSCVCSQSVMRGGREGVSYRNHAISLEQGASWGRPHLAQLSGSGWR